MPSMVPFIVMETFEVAYYQSLASDLTSANEKITEHRDLLVSELTSSVLECGDLKAEISRLHSTIDRLQIAVSQGSTF